MLRNWLIPSDADAVFKPRVGQILLAGVILIGFGLFAFFSIASNSAQNEIREDLYAQENDASALSFTQRDAFNLAFVLSEWGTGDRSARDVQVARALLGQRLNVITSGGGITYDSAPESFQNALLALDGEIIALEDAPLQERLEVLRTIDPVVEEFISETRALTQAFQEQSRSVIEASVQSRNLAELQLVLSFGLVFAALLILVTWIAIDIDRGYRRVNLKIQTQQKELTSTIATLERTQEADILTSQMIQQVSDGISIDQVLSEIGPAFSALLPGISVDVDLNGAQRGAVHVVVGADSPIGSEELETFVVRIRDVVGVALSRELAEQQMASERQVDALTGLSNRSVLTVETQRAFEEAKRAGGVAAIFLMDIDRFRDFNNSLGNASGDVLLIEIADRLRQVMIGSEIAARLSGDEYAVVARFSNREEATTRAKQFFDALHFTTLAGATETNISVSMGVAISEADAQTPADLQRSAAMAIYLAKENDRSGFVVFSEAEHSTLSDRLSEELAVRAALRSGEFKLYYQPIMKLTKNRPVGVEALIRWDRPGVGILAPDSFLDTTRRAGILPELSAEIIEEAMSFWSRGLVKTVDISRDGLPYVSINVDPIQLEDPLFAQNVLGAARRNSVPLAAIVLEVTERALSDSALAIEHLESLRRVGVRIALDDFGTGYSALGQAQHLPLDILKIDKSFIPADELTGRDRRLVSDIQAIAATLGLSTTVEGVETAGVAETLRDMGIDAAQGYLYSQALPEGEIVRWLEQWSPLASAEALRSGNA